MKIISVDKTKFEKRLGYIIFFMLNFLIILSISTMILESNSMYVKYGINKINGGDYGKYCYDSLLIGSQICNCYGICSGSDSERPKFHNALLFYFLIVILIVDSIVIYSKQNKLKFTWYNNRELHNLDKGVNQ
mgnify:CR=1 FL=1